jgi:hypothetical protein
VKEHTTTHRSRDLRLFIAVQSTYLGISSISNPLKDADNNHPWIVASQNSLESEKSPPERSIGLSILTAIPPSKRLSRQLSVRTAPDKSNRPFVVIAYV